MSENRIVYSSDGSGKNLADNKKKKSAADYPVIEPASTTLKLRLEKKGRGGKTVTVIFSLPDNPPYFKNLLKEIKNHCGTGGTQKDDALEIQGDYLSRVRDFLAKKGFQVKG